MIYFDIDKQTQSVTLPQQKEIIFKIKDKSKDFTIHILLCTIRIFRKVNPKNLCS